MLSAISSTHIHIVHRGFGNFLANLAIHAHAGGVAMHAGADKLVRDAIIWTHIAGDSVQRMKSVRGLLK